MIEINGYKITATIFPDKTSQVWKIPESILNADIFNIDWEFESEDELIHLAQLKTLLTKVSDNPVYLYIPYFPYARQDKEVSNTSTFALHTFCHFLNSLNFTTILTFDLHSNLPLILLPNLKELSAQNIINNLFLKLEYNLVCYPDKGALTRYKTSGTPSCTGEKIRDPLTGNITSYILDADVSDKTVLIVDDICDGGSTFINLAKELQKGGAKEISLYISHGIFSKGIDILRNAGIKRIFTKEKEIL